MKNIEIKTLNEVVPKEIRLEVYKEALELYKEDSPKIYQDTLRTRSRGLCILLPMVLWGLDDFDPFDQEREWYWKDTFVAFSELNKTIIGILEEMEPKDKPAKRQEYLNRWIKELELA